MIVEAALVVVAIATVSLLGVQIAKWVERLEQEPFTESAKPSIGQQLEALGGDPAASSANDAAYRAAESATDAVLRGRAKSDLQMAEFELEVTVVDFRQKHGAVFETDGDYLLSDGTVVRQELRRLYWRATGDEVTDAAIVAEICAERQRQAKQRRMAAWKEEKPL